MIFFFFRTFVPFIFNPYQSARGTHPAGGWWLYITDGQLHGTIQYSRCKFGEQSVSRLSGLPNSAHKTLRFRFHSPTNHQDERTFVGKFRRFFFSLVFSYELNANDTPRFEHNLRVKFSKTYCLPRNVVSVKHGFKTCFFFFLLLDHSFVTRTSIFAPRLSIFYLLKMVKYLLL